MTHVETIRRWAGRRWGVPWRSVRVRVRRLSKLSRFYSAEVLHPGRHGAPNAWVWLPTARPTRAAALAAAAWWARPKGRSDMERSEGR